MKTSVHYVDQMEFLDFPSKTEHLLYNDIHSLYSFLAMQPKRNVTMFIVERVPLLSCKQDLD